MAQETFEFQAEARQLLNLVVNSIYSNKDIFLRELLSNASDAMDKLRLEKLTDSDLDADISDLHIRLQPNVEERTLTITDNGVGMSYDEVKSLIGTIARSGTAEFLKEMKESRSQEHSAELIGQFGVGFYSVFMVADKVTLNTRRAGQTQGTHWESCGEGSYTIEEVADLPQGTSITLHLKAVDEEDGMSDYTKEWTLRDLVKRYSDFLSYPIKMQVTRKEKGEDDVEKEVTEDDTLNSMQALWARPSSEVEAKEYNEFYRHVAHDWNDPLETISMKGEGTFEFQALLFLPAHAPLDLFMPDYNRGVQLYVKRVFIMDRCEELVPEYLRFLRGVVDAQDLSLNISREILQKDRQIKAISKALTRKVLSTLKDMKENRSESYMSFWQEFGKVVKEGLYRDRDQQKALLDLVMASSTDSDKLTSLADYVSRMKPGQDAIYYITGDNLSVMQNSPHLEVFKEKGYEVLLLSEPVDAVWVETVSKFQDVEFKSVLRGSLELGSEEEKKETENKLEAQRQDMAGMLTWLGQSLSEQVKEVRLSSRLKNSPACLVSASDDPSPAMEKIMKAMGHDIPPVKRIMELNAAHPVVERLQQLHSQNADDPMLGKVAEVLYSQALIAEGGELSDPSKFSGLLTELMTKALA